MIRDLLTRGYGGYVVFRMAEVAVPRELFKVFCR
jgi:hypothetical protein